MAENRELQLHITLKDKLSGQLSKTQASLQNFAKVGAVAVTALGAGFAVAIKQAAEFETKMSNISTLISGDSTEAINGLRKGILEMTKSMPKSADELGAAAYDIVSAGIEGTAGQLSVLDSSAKLATAGLGNTSEAVDIVTSAINAFGIDAEYSEDVANSFFLAVKNGKTTVSALSQGFGQIAPLANQMGVSFNELLASTSALTTTGLQASVAYTQIRASLSNLAKPTKEMQQAFDIMGITSENLDEFLSSRGLSGTFRELEAVAKSNGIELSKMFGSVEALNAVLSLTGETGDKAQEIWGQMTESTGDLTEAFEKQKQTASASWQILKNNFSVILIEIGSRILPPLANAMRVLAEEVLPSVMSAVGTTVQFFKDHKLAAIALAGAVGGMAVAAFVALIPVIWGAVVAFGAMAVAVAPFILGGVVIAGIVAGIMWIVKNWEMLSAKAMEIWGMISTVVGGLISGLIDSGTQKFNAFSNVIQTVLTFISNIFTTIWTGISKTLLFTVGLMIGLVVGLFELFGVDIIQVFKDIKNFISWAWEAISEKTAEVTAMMSEGISTFLAFINTVWTDTWNMISTFFSEKWAELSNLARIGMGKLRGLITELTKPIEDAFGSMWEGIGNVATGTFEGIKGMIKGMINWMVDKINWFIRQANMVASKGNVIPGVEIPQIPEIPRLARGGIVTSPTTALIGEHGAEAVIPLNKLGQFGLGGGSGVNITITGNNITSDTDLTELGEKVGEAIMNKLRLNERLNFG